MAFERFLEWVSDGFVRLLTLALKNTRTRAITLLTALGLFFSSFFLVTSGLIGNAFMEAGERGEFLVGIVLPQDASLRQTDAITKDVEVCLRRQPEVVRTFTTVGSNNKAFGLSAPNIAEIEVFFDALRWDSQRIDTCFCPKNKG